MAKSSGKKSIINLWNILKNLPAKKRELFERFYVIEESTGRMKVPTPMKKWVPEKFGSVEKIERQKIVHISNRFTGEGTLFNELRALRPFDAKSSEKLNFEKEDLCNFCSMEECTPQDSFGRIKGNYCTTASNIAKYDYFHGIVIFKEHNPLKLKKEWLEDYLKTSEKWFMAVEKTDCRARTRFLMWNCLWKSGASLIHGHMQLTSSKSEYGRLKHLRETAEGYEEIFGTDYFEDLYSIHESIGLAKKSGKSRIIFYLTPKKEKEIMILSKAESFVELSLIIFRIIEKYKKLGVQSYNLAMFQVNGWWVCSIVDRGDLNNKSSDIGAMELFADSVVSSDPFKLAEKF